MKLRPSLLLPWFSLAVGLVVVACASSDAVENNNVPQPPAGFAGSFSAQGGGPPNQGYGASGSASPMGMGGTSGDAGQAGGPPVPPQCEDALKRCPHEFTFPVGSESSVELRGSFAPGAWDAGIAMVKSGTVWKATVDIPWNQEVEYKFWVNNSTWVIDPNNQNKKDDGFGSFNSLLAGETCDFWSCDSPPMGTFDWRDSVLYFVFVDRFFDGNPANNGTPVSGVSSEANYQGGDWAGVKAKLEAGYFTDLGVNTLWLTVPMDNPNVSGVGSDGKNYSAYHGYWPSDLDNPEEHFGSLAELKDLVDTAHGIGIKVILDYAMNHVHLSSPVFQEHPSWFWPLDENGKHCVCGDGCSWDIPYDARRCWFTDYLPDFNFTNPEARQFSVNNAVQWVKNTGIDGFRLDAVKHIEDSWLIDLRTKIKAEIEPTSGEHFYMVGETFTGDRDLIKYYVNPSTMLDGQFDFPMRMQLASNVLMRHGSMNDLANFLNSNESYYGNGIMSTFIGNHDIPRPIHLAEDTPLWSSEWDDGKNLAWNNKPSLPGGTNAFERLGNAFTILFTLKGVPLIYYGDEIGMPGAGDPDNRRMMQWPETTAYSAGQTKLLNHIKTLTKTRAAHPALRRGTRTPLSASNDTLAYQMQLGTDTVIVLINRADSQQGVTNVPSGTWQDALSNASVSGGTVQVPPRSGMVLVNP
jgi:glycosidase